MTMSRLMAILFFLGIVGTAAADVLPPGSKWVSHYARFENLTDYPDYVFYISHHPNSEFRGDPEKQKGKPFPINAKPLAAEPENAVVGLTGNPINGNKYLIAVPKKLLEVPGAGPNSNWFDGNTPGVLQAVLNRGYRAAPESEKRNEFWTHFRVEITNGTMTLTPTRDDKPGDGGGASNEPTANDNIRWYIAGGLGLFAVVLLAGWIIFLRRK